jgi:hypothetical protein
VCRLPIDFRSLGTFSEVDLVRESGYLSALSAVTVELLADCLANHPDWCDAWFGWSDDKRSSPSWWLDGTGPSEYRLGYYDPSLERQAEPILFNDRVRACAEFVSLELESLTRTIARIDAARLGGESDLEVAIRLTQMDERRG